MPARDHPRRTGRSSNDFCVGHFTIGALATASAIAAVGASRETFTRHALFVAFAAVSGETRTLLTYGVLVDVGASFGLVGNLFEDRLRAHAIIDREQNERGEDRDLPR